MSADNRSSHLTLKMVRIPSGLYPEAVKVSWPNADTAAPDWSAETTYGE